MRTGFKTALQRNRSVVIFGVQLSIWIVFSLTWARVVDSAVFNCSSGDVTCLIAAINEANGLPGEHIINLAPGTYTVGFPGEENELPSITGSIRIQASADDLPTVIEGGLDVTIFHVSVGGELSLDGVTVQRGIVAIINFGVTSLQDSIVTGFDDSEAIINFGVISLQDSVVTDNNGDGGTIHNFGTLNLYRTIVANNNQFHLAGGILNETGGNVLIESSTIAHNRADGAGGIRNDDGSVIVKNSSIIFNAGSEAGGIGNNGGDLQIVNSTIARNASGNFGCGGGVDASGFVSITNSTIRENHAFDQAGGGICGPVMLQNTIVAGNTISGEETKGPDCFGLVTNLGNNLIGDPTDCAINLQPSDLTGDPGLGPLVGTEEDVPPGRAFYPVLAGSVVIGAANPAACPETDQLGNPRIGTCDIGAIEFPSPAPSIVNNLVSFVPLTATFKTTSNTVGCPNRFVGKFSFDARLTNTTKGVTLSNLIVEVTTLTNGNLLKRADGLFVGGTEFVTSPRTLKVVKADHFSDGLLSPGEFVDQPFTICLRNKDPFSFFVDVLGIQSDNAAKSVALK